MTVAQMIERGYEWCPTCKEVTIPLHGCCLWCARSGWYGATKTLRLDGAIVKRR